MVHLSKHVMFSLGFGEILVICVILIVVVGPERLPGLMKTVGKGMRTVRQASRDIRATVGLDELMREDVLTPPPRRPLPSATVSRALPAPPPADAPPAQPAEPEVQATSPGSADAVSAGAPAGAEDKSRAS